MSGRRHVARGVPGGRRVDDHRRRRSWWGDLHALCPDDLLTELNAGKDPRRLGALLKRYRARRR